MDVGGGDKNNKNNNNNNNNNPMVGEKGFEMMHPGDVVVVVMEPSCMIKICC